MTEKTEIFSRGQRSGKTAELVREIKADALREAVEKIEKEIRHDIKTTPFNDKGVRYIAEKRGLIRAKEVIDGMIKE